MFCYFRFSHLFSLVAGGPGSGKVTHCDTLMEEKRGVTHINMMDLLHQHVISNGKGNTSSALLMPILY